eukprot:5727239-Prymnesium_polylepis.1
MSCSSFSFCAISPRSWPLPPPFWPGIPPPPTRPGGGTFGGSEPGVVRSGAPAMPDAGGQKGEGACMISADIMG